MRSCFRGVSPGISYKMALALVVLLGVSPGLGRYKYHDFYLSATCLSYKSTKAIMSRVHDNVHTYVFFSFFFSSHYTQSLFRFLLVHMYRFHAKERSFIGVWYDNLLAEFTIYLLVFAIGELLYSFRSTCAHSHGFCLCIYSVSRCEGTVRSIL